MSFNIESLLGCNATRSDDNKSTMVSPPRTPTESDDVFSSRSFVPAKCFSWRTFEELYEQRQRQNDNNMRAKRQYTDEVDHEDIKQLKRKQKSKFFLFFSIQEKFFS